MKLIEILKEAQKLEKSKIKNMEEINAEDEVLKEAKKKARKGMKAKIRAKYNRKKSQALKIANKLKARKNKINWTDDLKEIRNEIVTAFMNNDPDKVIEMMAKPDGYKVIEILKALEVAHGGYEKLEMKAAKAGAKNFVKTVYAYIEELEDEEYNF